MKQKAVFIVFEGLPFGEKIKNNRHKLYKTLWETVEHQASLTKITKKEQTLQLNHGLRRKLNISCGKEISFSQNIVLETMNCKKSNNTTNLQS